MGDYFDEDVSGNSAETLVRKIRNLLEEFPSVQLIRKKKRINGVPKKRTILRTWRVEFDVEGATHD